MRLGLKKLTKEKDNEKAAWSDKLSKGEISSVEYEEWIDGEGNLTDEPLVLAKLEKAKPGWNICCGSRGSGLH